MTKKTKIVKNWRHLVEREDGLLYKTRATKTPFTGVFEGRIWSAVKYYRIEYKNGKLDGFCEEYASNGSLWIRNNFKKGELHGTCLQFNQDQDYKTLWSITNYKNGELHGVFEGVGDDNVLSERSVFKNGKSHVSKVWTPGGGHCAAICSVGNKAALKYAQNQATKNITSDAINSAIP